MRNTVDLFTNFTWTINDHFGNYIHHFCFVDLFVTTRTSKHDLFFLDPDQTFNEENVGVYIVLFFFFRIVDRGSL